MSAVSLRQSELPGTRPIYRDFLVDFRQVGGFYAHPPSVEAACAAASDVRLGADHRRKLVEELARQNNGGDASTLASLERLSDPGTVVVATGQQVGLLGGPVFTLYKALTAVRCAEELTRNGVPAVPVFWLATEDHDLEEVRHCWAFSASGEPSRIDAVTEGEAGAAVGEIRIADSRLDRFRDLCDGLPYADEASALARDAYGGEREFGTSFRALYRRLLSGTGILFLSPMQEGIRELAAPLMRRAIERAPDLTDQLVRRGTGLRAAGYHQQVRVLPSTSLVMLFENASRVALERRNGSYWIESRAFTSKDLLARLDRAPLDISPTALLRPVVQDYLLPTAALIAGPSEAAYLAQSAVLYESLLGRMPAVLPRASYTVIDSVSRKLLRKYRMGFLDCMASRAELEARVAASLVPTALRQSIRSHRDRIDESLQGIELTLLDFDPTLAESFRRSRSKIGYQLEKIGLKVYRESLRRSGTARRHAARLSDTLFPNGHLQERIFGVLSFVARFGMSFVDRVRAETQPGSADHKAIVV